METYPLPRAKMLPLTVAGPPFLPVTVTLPIESVDLDAVDLVVYVLDGDGVWQSVAVTVTTQVVDGQMVATFTLPAGVTLAPAAAGLDVFAAGDRSRSGQEPGQGLTAGLR